MAIQTRSQFYSLPQITSDNYALDFNEGAAELQASIELGSYSHNEIVTQVALQLNTVGGQTYTVTLDRSTRFVTISAPGNFSILCSSGTRIGVGAWGLLGFTGSDKTGTNTYTGTAIGTSYRPQFWLQKYVPIENLRKKTSASISKATSGIVQVVNFGNEQFMECEISFITNQTQVKDGPIEHDSSGVVNAIAFLNAVTDKSFVEFMPDRDNPNTFTKMILDKTEESPDGTGYRLIELLEKNIRDYYRTGKLTFRKVN
jgi:hypothetical protein